jgi:hypothetical protein
VTLAILAALAMHSDNPWWAGLSAFMVTRASPAVTLSRGLMRIVGSVVGAAIGVQPRNGAAAHGRVLRHLEHTEGGHPNSVIGETE